MVDKQTVIIIMSGMLSGFIAGYLVKWGDDIRIFYKNKLRLPDYILPLFEFLTMFAVLLVYWLILIIMID